MNNRKRKNVRKRAAEAAKTAAMELVAEKLTTIAQTIDLQRPIPDDLLSGDLGIKKRDALSRGSWPDWCMVGVTVILGFIAYLQWRTSDFAAKTAESQEKITRIQAQAQVNDERAWMKVEVFPSEESAKASMAGHPYTDFSPPLKVIAGKPITAPLVFTNVGKSPASGLKMFIYVSLQENMIAPRLDCVEQIGRCVVFSGVANLVFPQQMDAVSAPIVSPTGSYVATAEDEAKYQNGESYIAVFGSVSYTDIFGNSHWTKFCSRIMARGNPGTNTRDCTSFSDAK